MFFASDNSGPVHPKVMQRVMEANTGYVMSYGKDDIMEEEIVSGITCDKGDAKVTLIGVPDVPGVAAKIFGPLAEHAINVDVIVQNISQDGKSTDMTFTVPQPDLHRVMEVLRGLDILKDVEIREDADVVKLSVVGIGMRSHAGVAQTMFSTLAEKGINIQLISTSEIKVSVLISSEYTELAIRALHDAYKLEEKRKI